MMGFGCFGSTKNKKVPGNDKNYGVSRNKDLEKSEADRQQMKETLFAAVDEFKEQTSKYTHYKTTWTSINRLTEKSVEARQDLVNPQVLETIRVAFELLTK